MARINGYEFPDGLLYDPREHLWLRPGREGEAWLVTVGVDSIGQDALGEIVHIQLMEAGRTVVRGQAVGSLEAEKMVRPVLAPVSGALAQVNGALLAKPRLLNLDPYGEGWLFRVLASNWEPEQKELLRGEEAVTAWIRAELQAMNDRR